MKIPDLILPIVAWRVWQWDTTGLRSLNAEPWLPGKRLQAGCRVSHNGIRGSRASVAASPHDAPEFKCTCGIYASKSLDHLRRTQFWQYGSVHGEVSLWGTVVEHKDGFRSEFAYPKTLHLPSDSLPVTLKQIESRIQSLIGYGCNLSINHDNLTIPLWSRELGLHATGMDFLLSRGQEWYARRKHERTLKAGDRIAVLGLGIALVEVVGDEHMRVVLWNRTVLGIRKRAIVWDERNMRWEAHHSQALP